MKKFSISIPEPCHEDWNKMTPDAKGAFCASCNKSVHDFSKKTDEEIIEVFEKNGKEKVCGRFTSAQLSQPVVSYSEGTPSGKLAKFLYAILMAFGSSLFFGLSAYGQKGREEMKMGKMAYRPTPIELTTVEDTTISSILEPVKPNTPVTCGLRNPDNIIETLGEVMYIPEPINITGDTILTETIIETLPPTPADIDTIVTTSIIDTEALIIPDPIIYAVGGISYVQIIEADPIIIDTAESVTEEEILPHVEDTTQTISTPVSENAFLSNTLDVVVSPNPSKGQIIVSYSLKNDMPVKIDLFDPNGRFLKTLTDLGKQYAGKYNVSYDLSELQNGIYTVAITTSDRKISSKIVLAR